MHFILALALLLAQYVHRSNPGTPDQTGPAITAAGASNTCPGTGCVVMDCSSVDTVFITIAGTWTATLNFYGSNDGWVTQKALIAYPYNTSTGALSAGVNTTTGNGDWQMLTSGTRSCGVYASLFTSNTSMAVRLDGDPSATFIYSNGVPGTSAALATVANDAVAIGNGIETQPAVARGAPTAVTAGRSEKLQVLTTSGGVITTIAGGTGSILTADVRQIDNAAGNQGLIVYNAVARAAPTAVGTGFAEAVQMDVATGGMYDVPIVTTTNVGTSQAVVTANTATSVKAAAGNVYGIAASNASASVCFLQFYNTAGAPTCGTSVIWSVPLPATPTVFNQPVGAMPLGNFSTGIAVCVSTTATGSTTCGSTVNGVTIFYK